LGLAGEKSSAGVGTGGRLSGANPGLELAKRAKHFSERRFADFGFEVLLQAVKRGDDAKSATLAMWLKSEQVGAGVAGIDFSLQQAFGFKRGDAVAKVAARGGKRLGELRWLDLARRFKEEGSQDEGLKKTKIVCGEHPGCERLEPACGAIDGEHGAFVKESVDAHEHY